MFEIVSLDINWNRRIRELPHAHLLQTSEWAQIKAEVGWQATPMLWTDAAGKTLAAALFLIRSVRLAGICPRVSVAYIPRGPILDWSDLALRNQVLQDIQAYARKAHVLFLKIDPELRVGTGVPGREDAWEDPVGQAALHELQSAGWHFSNSQVQFRNTVLLSLDGSEEDWLKRMKQKTRYNLRLAQRNGVVVREVRLDEFSELYKMYAETSVRDGFVIRSQEYYLSVWQTYFAAGMLAPLVAEVEGEKIAGLMLFSFGKTAWYLYGMSTALHREKMPNYLLQWEAMRIAKQKGCQSYDLWGAPDVFDESDSMFGVFRFKEGLGASVLRTCGAWDYIVQPMGYTLYQNILPKFLNILRRNRKAETRQEIGA
jgi:lipid II:glycine glycyltransferase (peptidoglycan interpeptide bridge formation enzyme)